MELDEMKRAWTEMSLRQDGIEALDLRIFRDLQLGHARRGLWPLAGWGVLQIFFGVVLSIWGAAFWATHLQPLHLLVCGLLLHAYGVLLIVLAANELYLIRRVDYAAPVLDIQRRIEALRAFRVRVEGPIHGTLGWFLWIPATLTLLASGGIDAWTRGGRMWVVASVAFSAAAAAVAWAVVAVLRRKGFARRFDDNAAGRGVLRAEAALSEIARFERE